MSQKPEPLVHILTRIWANAQRDGRPAEHRWRPLFNATNFGWRPLVDCHAVTVPKCESRWNWLGCPKLVNRSQPLVGRSSPYCWDIWRTYCCLTNFFSVCRYWCLSRKDIARQSCAMVPRWRFLATFLCPVFSVSHVQYFSDLHLKFALRPHHHTMCGSMADIQSVTAEIRRGEKKEK